jgi:hypothetical protein
MYKYCAAGRVLAGAWLAAKELCTVVDLQERKADIISFRAL